MRWKLVPTDVTPEILNADNEIGDGWIIKDQGEWASLLASAPPASQDEELVDRIAFVLCEYDEENPGTCGCGGHCTNSHAIGQARAVLKMLERGE